MRKFAGILAAGLAAVTLLSACGSAASGTANTPAPEQTANEAAFVPSLDTEKNVTLNVGSFFGNFEALIEVQNDFNVFYPNFNLEIQNVGRSDMPDFFTNNPNLDIFMTSNTRGYPVDHCVDLLSAGVDVSGARQNVIEGNKIDGILYALPMSLNLKGMVVNKTLLQKEGLSVPETWPEFLETLEALKQKGYTPIQGPNAAVANLCYNMGMVMLAQDDALLQAVQSGKAENAAGMNAVFDRLDALMEKGYISTAVNAEYPDDNYDGAILKFFEGDVPFWVCDTEKVSGMKKRESKSEAFSANPFDYTFLYAPTGDNGAYKYVEPWYGFAVNTDSSQQDYAIEFLRFMARREELNTLASVKGVPSIALGSDDSRYAELDSTKIEASVVSNGKVSPYFATCLTSAANKLLTGELPDAAAATASFVAACAAGEAENG